MPVESWAFAVPQAMIPPTTRTDAAQNGRTKAVRLCITLLRLETRRGYSGGGAELCVVFRICSYAATSLSEWLTWLSFYARHLVKEPRQLCRIVATRLSETAYTLMRHDKIAGVAGAVTRLRW